jgi:uncharacterized damage-inducible protein DinB
MNDIVIKDIIRQLKDAENGDLWLDENFEKKLAQVPEGQEFTRPLPGLHSVAELLSHLIVWRRINISRLKGQKVTMDVEDPANWKTNDQLRQQGWDALKKEFCQSQKDLIAMLDGKDDSYLRTISTHYENTYQYLLEGMIHHDMYHMGQLGITIKFLNK